MDISCIISSGDLELYVLGMLSEEDNLKVAQLAAIFPEIKNEIDSIEQSLLQMGDDTNDLPSALVKTNLFEKLRSTPTGEASNEVIPNQINEPVADEGEAKVIQMPKPKRNTFTTLMLAASVIGLIACIAFISHLSSANSHYHAVADNLQKQVNGLQQTTLIQQKNLDLYRSPDYLKINLTGVPGKPDALVQLFWSKATHDVYVADISLPVAPAGKQYQLWALIDGKPVNAGLLTAKKTPQQMVAFSRADAFAITLENAGGSPTPNLKELYVMGKTS